MTLRLSAVMALLLAFAACTTGPSTPSRNTPALAPSGFPDQKYSDDPAERRAIYRGSRAGVSSR